MTNLKSLKSYEKQVKNYMAFIIGDEKKEVNPNLEDKPTMGFYLSLANEIARMNRRIEYLKQLGYDRLTSDADDWTISKPSKINNKTHVDG